MRDLVFKNLTSQDKRRKIIASAEISDKEGVRSIIRRHFICLVREVKVNELQKPLSHLYVLKQRNTKEQEEKFFCRIKGCVFAVNKGRLLRILFMHTLKIHLLAIPQGLIQ
jgi:hypothetical protein